MAPSKAVIVSIAFLLDTVAADNRSFPPGFKFGVGTSSYQIEGGWNTSDKTESIWDHLVHTSPETIADRSTGDVACDSYNQWQRDIEMAVELGVHFYRFSISWPRLLPSGFPNKVSEDGKNYYNNLINGLLEKGIEPIVTIYHWELPQRLQDLGGWTNPLIANWFADYARVVYSLYADRVKTWVTINEPNVICDIGYSFFGFAPLIYDSEIGIFLCSKHVLMAHAKAWRVYDEEFRAKYNGMISLSNHVVWYEPMEGEDEDFAIQARALWEGRFSHPVYSKEGGWPPIIEEKMAEVSRREGFPRSRLPEFTKEEIEIVKGTFDYCGLNHYTSRQVRRQRPGEDVITFMLTGSKELGIVLEMSPKWPKTVTDWLRSNPEGLRNALVWLKSQYGDLKFLITENGCASAPGLDDHDRVEYHKEYLEQLLLAIHEDKVDVVGYTAWSLMDNFEWNDGYRTRFGLYEVDFEDPMRKRTAKKSAEFYANVIRSHSLDISQKYTNDELAIAVGGLQASLLQFPPDFKFGAATAAYQIEGAWNVSDKAINIWDQYTHKHRDMVADGSDGDVACDSYHQWQRDIEMADELGLDFYRFSIAWTRLMPNALSMAVSEDGKAYYNKLIDGLLAKGIQPVVTLYHWDVSQRLQDLGGWANPLIVDWFAAYARVVFNLYADRVKTWVTINEPLLVCDGGYNDIVAPGFKDAEVGVYLCNKNTLLAHAKAWRIYDEEFRPKYKGQISLSNHLIWYEPASKAEKELAALAMEHCAGRYSHPIFSKEGGWPPALEKFIAEKSIKEGFKRSRLPPFTNDEIDLVRGTYDFYGVNHYTSKLVRKPKPGEPMSGWPMSGSEELRVVLDIHPDWESTTVWWFKANPKGFRNLLVWLKQQYGDIKFLVTENGYPTTGSSLDDDKRVRFYKDYMTQMLLAMKKDNVNVIGYTAWSLMDNFEWRDGYSNKFGLYEVNFTDPLRSRTPRSSASFYANVIKSHTLDAPEESSAYVVWIVIGAVLALLVICGVLYTYCKKAKSKRKPDYESVAMHNNLNQKSLYTQ